MFLYSHYRHLHWHPSGPPHQAQLLLLWLSSAMHHFLAYPSRCDSSTVSSSDAYKLFITTRGQHVFYLLYLQILCCLLKNLTNFLTFLRLFECERCVWKNCLSINIYRTRATVQAVNRGTSKKIERLLKTSMVLMKADLYSATDIWNWIHICNWTSN